MMRSGYLMIRQIREKGMQKDSYRKLLSSIAVKGGEGEKAAPGQPNSCQPKEENNIWKIYGEGDAPRKGNDTKEGKKGDNWGGMGDW